MKATKEMVKAFRLGASLMEQYGNTVYQYNKRKNNFENILQKEAKNILKSWPKIKRKKK